MKKAIITLPKSTEDRDSLLMKRYQFIDGKMSVPILSDNCTNHQKIGGLLSKYYGCTVEIVDTEDLTDDEDSTDDSPEAKPAKAEPAKAATAKATAKSPEAQ